MFWGPLLDPVNQTLEESLAVAIAHARLFFQLDDELRHDRILGPSSQPECLRFALGIGWDAALETTVAPALVSLPIALAVACALIAVVVLGGMRQRQKRLAERHANARQLDTGAGERTQRAEHDRESARERAEQAEGSDQDR